MITPATYSQDIYNGLQTRIKAVDHLAEYVPCGGHTLNLAGTSAAESCATASLLSESTHRWSVLLDILRALKEGCAELKSTLEVIGADSNQARRTRAEASRLADEFVQQTTCRSDCEFGHGMRTHEQSQQQLQSVTIDLGIVVELCTSLVAFTEEVRHYVRY